MSEHISGASPELNLEVTAAPAHTLICSLLSDPELDPPSKAASPTLSHRNSKIINVY